MNKNYQDQLNIFQSDYNRSIEETFAQTFSEKEDVRLFFVNENQAFTDGRNIVVDPAEDGLFYDSSALVKTEAYLGWESIISTDSWYALKMITRAQNIHECLHILYTDFPGGVVSDKACDTKNKKIVASLISNIIEDAYIEAVGCSVYDNLEMYLQFGRISRLFASFPSEGTVTRAFKEIEQNPQTDGGEVVSQQSPAELSAEQKCSILTDFLDYMATFLLYPMVIQPEPDGAFAAYVTKTKKYFVEGSTAASPAERYEYVKKIFEAVSELIPEDGRQLPFDEIKFKIGGTKTHASDASTIGNIKSVGRTQSVDERLFTGIDGIAKPQKNHTGQLQEAARDFENDKQISKGIASDEGAFVQLKASSYDCSVLHNKIKINESHPKINQNLRKAYQNIYNKYHLNINAYNNKFLQILKAQAEIREEKQLFGAGISSKRLGDPKKRYWYRSAIGNDIPDLSVLLLIDGSGSMSGARENSARISSVILHEVLKRQGIEHAIVEHRGCFDKSEIDINILVDFNAREDEKLNIMQIDGYGDNRDGLALYWAERYIGKNSRAENKLIIVLSDGEPAHEFDDYYPPVSTKDTENAVRKITGRGTKIIAVALDDEESFDTYETLKEIYPETIGCNNLERLTGQLLNVISRQLSVY